MSDCTCIPCQTCQGRGFQIFDAGSSWNDDPDDYRQCDECDGTGVVDFCDDCRNAVDEENDVRL